MKFELVTITHKFKLKVVEVLFYNRRAIKKVGEDFSAVFQNKLLYSVLG